MAGANVRYRKRLRAFERIRMQTRTVCWDERFLYIEQSMWNTKKECAGHIVYRAAFVGADGVLPKNPFPPPPPVLFAGVGVLKRFLPPLLLGQ